MKKIFALCTMVMSISAAHADIICQRKNEIPRPIHISTRVQALKIITSGTCPRGFKKVGELAGLDQTKVIASGIVDAKISTLNLSGITGATGAVGATGAMGLQGPAGARGATGAQGPAGAQGLQGAQGQQGPQGQQGVAGPAGAVGPAGAAGLNDSQVRTIVTNTLATQSGPIANVMYAMGPSRVVSADGVTVFSVEGYARLLYTGDWSTRTIVRQGSPSTDTTAGLLNSPVVCDTGFVINSGNSFTKTSCPILLESNGVFLAYFTRPMLPTYRFPILRAQTGTLVLGGMNSHQCLQQTLDGNIAESFEMKLAVANSCGFGSSFQVGASDFVAVGIPVIPNGRGVAPDLATMNQICKLEGYDAMYSYGTTNYASCRDNSVIIYSATTNNFDVIGACGYRRRVSSLNCYKITGL